MTTFTLQWSPTKLSHLKNEVYAHFFLLERNGKVLYIGNVHHQDLTATIAATFRNLHLDQGGIQVHLGRLREYGRRSISKEAMNSLHNLLVFACKPRYNQQCKLAYQGIANLKLINSGIESLPTSVRAENRIVFLRKRTAAPNLNFEPRKAG